MSLLVLAALAETGLLTWRTAARGRPPAAGGGKIIWPCDLAAVAIVYGLLGILGEAGGDWPKVAATAGWGFVAATTLNLFDPTSLAKAQKTVAAKPTSVTPQQQGAAS